MRRKVSAAIVLCLASVVCGAACSQDKDTSGSVQRSAQQPQVQSAPGAPASPPAPSSATPAEPTAVQIEQFANDVLAELDAVRVGQPLGEWKKNHAVGTVERYGPLLSEQANKDWCARVRLETSLDAKRKLRRDAYFYLPDPPAVMSMPAGTPDGLVGQCRLGFVWAEIEDEDASRAERLADAARESLTSVLGAGQLNAKVHWSGSGAWRKTTLWKQRGLSLATAATDSRPWRSSDLRTTTRVLVAAAGGTSGITLGPFQPPAETPEEYVERFRVIESRINEAISAAAVSGTAESNIRTAVKVLSDFNPPWRYPRGADRMFILDAINGWLASAPTPSVRRAAALFVADRLLAESGIGWGKDENPPIRQQLEALGAQFNWIELGGTWLYAHSWLRESLETDPDGRIGDLAFITLMERGFETSGMCRDQGGDGFHAVIGEGSDFLSRKPDSPLTSYVHLLMAQAWGDIVRLSNGGGYDQSVASDKSEETYARGQAIDEYRLAFASPIQRPAKEREAWRNAWRMMAGLSPTRTYFYCVYD